MLLRFECFGGGGDYKVGFFRLMLICFPYIDARYEWHFLSDILTDEYRKMVVIAD